MTGTPCDVPVPSKVMRFSMILVFIASWIADQVIYSRISGKSPVRAPKTGKQKMRGFV
jgi:hypothetical protein